MKKQWFLAMIGLAMFCVNLGGRGNTVKLLVVTDPPRADVTIWGTHPVHGVSPMNIELPKSFFPYIHNHDCQGLIVDVTASKIGFNLIQQRTVIPIKDKHKRRGRHHSAWGGDWHCNTAQKPVVVRLRLQPVPTTQYYFIEPVNPNPPSYYYWVD